MIGRRAPDAYAAVTWLFAGPDGDTNTLALRGSGRLDADNTARIAKGLDRRAGVTRGTSPLRLRHQGNLQAPGLAGGDVRKVRWSSRHAKPETLLRYDDDRRDEAGAVAHLPGGDPL